MVRKFIHSSICIPDFPIVKGRGGSRPRRTRNTHGFQQSRKVLLAPHQDGPGKVGDVITPPGPWATCRAASPWVLTAGLVSSI